MRVGIFGSGDVAKSFGRGFLNDGHEVMLGSRDPGKLASWVSESGNGASSGTFADAASFGELLVIAVAGTSAVDAIQMAGIDNFRGKVVIDATNPLDMSVRPPRLLGGLGTSSGELIQKSLGGAFVVKAFFFVIVGQVRTRAWEGLKEPRVALSEMDLKHGYSKRRCTLNCNRCVASRSNATTRPRSSR